MVARIVNLADPDERETACATMEDAERALSEMVDRFKAQGCRVTEQRPPGEDYPQYAVYDQSDAWIGTYTIILQ